MNGVNVLEIRADRTVVAHTDGDLLRLANAAFAGDVEVGSCHSPHIDNLIGAVHGTGLLLGHPVNVKAWALYGGSPIVGTMFVSYDSPYRALPDEFVNMLLGATDWVGASTRARMAAFLDG